MKWDETELLRYALVDLAPHVQQMATELVSYLISLLNFFLELSIYLLILGQSFSGRHLRYMTVC